MYISRASRIARVIYKQRARHIACATHDACLRATGILVWILRERCSMRHIFVSHMCHFNHALRDVDRWKLGLRPFGRLGVLKCISAVLPSLGPTLARSSTLGIGLTLSSLGRDILSWLSSASIGGVRDTERRQSREGHGFHRYDASPLPRRGSVHQSQGVRAREVSMFSSVS